MKTISWLYAGALAIGIALLLSMSQASINAGQPAGGTVPIDNDDLGGLGGQWVTPPDVARLIEEADRFVSL